MQLCDVTMIDPVDTVPERVIPPKRKHTSVLPELVSTASHSCTHCPPRAWCHHCAYGHSMEDPRKKRRRSRQEIFDTPEVFIDYMLLGRVKDKDKTETDTARDERSIYCVHAIDAETLARFAMVGRKGPVGRTVEGLIEFLNEIGRTKVVIKTANEPELKAFTTEVVRRRKHETLVVESPDGDKLTVDAKEHCNYRLGCQIRTLHSRIEKNLGITLGADTTAAAWTVRHAAWIMNRFDVGRDGFTPFEQYRGKSYNGEVCELFENVYWAVPPAQRIQVRWEDFYRLMACEDILRRSTCDLQRRGH